MDGEIGAIRDDGFAPHDVNTSEVFAEPSWITLRRIQESSVSPSTHDSSGTHAACVSASQPGSGRCRRSNLTVVNGDRVADDYVEVAHRSIPSAEEVQPLADPKVVLRKACR